MLKLLAKIYCLIQKTPLVPEDYVGTLIAQRTDRQMTLPFDFLSVRFPQIAIPSIREIRVSTHVNFELRSDFIATLAKTAVKPINQFTADLIRSVPSTVVPDVNLSPPTNINITPRSSTDFPSLAKLEQAMTLLIAKLQKDNDTLLDTDEFHNYLRQEMLIAGLDTMTLDRMWKKAHDEVRDMDTTLEKERTEQFLLLKKYLDTEALETQEQQKNLEKLYNNQHLLTEGDFAQFASSRESLSDQAYHAYETARSRGFVT